MGIDRRKLGAPPWWRLHGPVIDDDGGTVAHVYWRDGALVDRNGNSWTQNGTVPQVGAAGTIPPSAGPYSDANYYSLGAGADVLDFAGDFSGYIVFIPITLTGVQALIENGSTGSGSGFQLYTSTATLNFGLWTPGFAASTAGGSAVAGAVNVASFGVGGGLRRVKLNLNAIAGAAATPVVPTTVQARIGRADGTGQSAGGIRILEAMFTSTAADDTTFIATVNTIFQRLKRSAP